MNKKKYLVLVIAVVTFGLLLAGGTYAWLTFGPAIIGNNTYNGTSTCFLVDYNYENDDGTIPLGGTLFQSSAPKTGLSGKVSMAMNAECMTCGIGTIYLKVNSGTSNILYSKVNKAHCEDPNTLKTMTGYTTSSSCTTAGYSWVNNKSALKYAVYEDIDSNPLSVGYIDGVKDITIHTGFSLNRIPRNFYVYVWLDGELADNKYLGVSFDGDIHLSAVQTEECEIIRPTGEAYAVYSADDTSLRFYRSETPIEVGSTYNGLTSTTVYTGFEEEIYAEEDEVPWIDFWETITNVVVEDVIMPISTANWFSSFVNCSNFDLSSLNTSEVINMKDMFVGAGEDTTTFKLDLSYWDVSNVTDMSSMFASAGANATTWSIGDLSGWDVSNVTRMDDMFWGAGKQTNSFSIIGLDNWNVSSVTKMQNMFREAGTNATNNWSIGNIGSWDVSNVTNMSYMFSNAGYSADYSLDLSSWNVCRATTYVGFRSGVVNKITEPSWGMSCPA